MSALAEQAGFRLFAFLRIIAARRTPHLAAPDYASPLGLFYGDAASLWRSNYSDAQPYIESCRTRPDFLYRNTSAAIYIDGPPHDFPERIRRDAAKTSELEDAGYIVIRFSHHDDWLQTVRNYPSIFGTPDDSPGAPPPETEKGG